MKFIIVKTLFSRVANNVYCWWGGGDRGKDCLVGYFDFTLTTLASFVNEEKQT
jgi:hypothetical protein